MALIVLQKNSEKIENTDRGGGVSTLNDNQAKEHSRPLSALQQKIKKEGSIGNRKKTHRDIFTSLLDMKHREDGGS